MLVKAVVYLQQMGEGGISISSVCTFIYFSPLSPPFLSFLSFTISSVPFLSFSETLKMH